MPEALKSDDLPVSSLARLYGPEPQQHAPETVAYVVRRMAEEFGEDPEAILREIEHEPPTPAGRFILKLLRFTAPEVRRGRPRHGSTPETRERDRIIYRVVEELRDSGTSLSEAFSLAPAWLARQGIQGREKPRVDRKTVMRAYRQHRETLGREFAVRWFEPPPA